MSAKLTADQVTAALGVEPSGRAPEGFSGVTIDTRRAAQGELFVAIRGERYDGNDFLDAAVAAGVSGAIGEDRGFADRAEIAFWAVPDGRAALQALASHYRNWTHAPQSPPDRPRTVAAVASWPLSHRGRPAATGRRQ